MAWVLCKSISLVLLATSLSLFFFSSSAEWPRFQQDTKADGSLSFLVVGDWGRKGAYNQTKVAEQMGRIGEKLDIDFIISTGDNFYENGLEGVNDPAFEESFTHIYTADSLKKQWYSVLGNHDYRGDVLAQLSPVLTKIDSRWLCMRSFIVDAEIVEFFFVDTTPFVKKYWDEPGDDVYDWRDVSPRDVYIANLLKDLQSALKESSATWKIVVGHHTMRSAGHHGDTIEIVELILPLLKAYNVDFYVNGHDHCVEQIVDLDSPLQFLTSGGGSKAWRGDVDYGYKGLQFYYDGQGFMSMQLTKEEAKIVYFDVYGNILRTLNISKQQYGAI